MAHGSGDDPNNDRRPAAEDWDALNSKTDMPRLDLGRITKPRKREFAVPTQAPEDVPDIAIGQIRNRGGLLALVVIILLGAGLYYLNVSTPATDLAAGPAIRFNSPTLQEAGRVGDEIKAPPLPTRRNLEFISEPPGAVILLNGNLGPGKTPSTVSGIGDVGGIAEIRLHGHQVSRLQLPSGQSRFTAELKSQKTENGSLVLNSVPTGASVTMNGVALGTTPLEALPASTDGTLHVRFELDGHHAHTVLSSVKTGEERRITVPMTPKNGVRKMATVRIEADPMVTRIDDLSPGGKPIFLGSTGYRPLSLTQRVGDQFHLRASAPDHEQEELWLDVVDTTYTIQIRLKAREKSYGTLALKGSRKVEVYLDSNQLDPLPMKARKVTAGPHTIVVMDPESRARKKFEIQIQADQKLSHTVLFEAGEFSLK